MIDRINMFMDLMIFGFFIYLKTNFECYEHKLENNSKKHFLFYKFNKINIAKH